MSNNVLNRTFQILDGANSDAATKTFQVFIMTLISLNVLMVIIETEESLGNRFQSFFYTFEIFSVAIFTIEYIGRIIVCNQDPKYQGKKFARLRLVVSPMMLVDLAAILPFFIPFVVTDVRFIRIIRLLRLFRLFKLARYSEPMQTLAEVFKSKAGDLAVAFFLLFIVLIFASSLMYNVEHEAQPEVFPSIPAAMWWGIVTLTTIGYGDVFPVTIPGKLVAAAVAVIGIAVYAIPTGIMASAFTEQLRKKHEGKKTCPHCGKEIL